MAKRRGLIPAARPIIPQVRTAVAYGSPISSQQRFWNDWTSQTQGPRLETGKLGVTRIMGQTDAPARPCWRGAASGLGFFHFPPFRSLQSSRRLVFFTAEGFGIQIV